MSRDGIDSDPRRSAALSVSGCGVAGSVVIEVKLGIVGAWNPGRTAAMAGRVQACPGLEPNGVLLRAAGRQSAPRHWQKRPHLLQAPHFWIVYADKQLPASPISLSGSYCMGIRSPVQAHLA